MTVIGFLKLAYRTIMPESVRRKLSVWRRVGTFKSVPGMSFGQLDELREYFVVTNRPIQKVNTRYGIDLYVDVRDNGVGLPIFLQLDYEPDEIQFLKQNLKHGNVLFDCGANLGLFTTLGSGLVGSLGVVVAVEPELQNFNLLQSNCTVNNCKNVNLINAALGSEFGSSQIFKSDTNFGDHRLGQLTTGRTAQEVRVDTVDRVVETLGLPRIDVFKIDVQGYEAKVFSGMLKTLAELPPRFILTEYWPHGIESNGDNPTHLLDRLLAFGYQLNTLNKDGSISPATLESALALLPDFDAASPDSSYINLVLMHIY